MGILSVNLDNINLDDNFIENGTDTTIHWVAIVKMKKAKHAKHLKKDKWRINVSNVES